MHKNNWMLSSAPWSCSQVPFSTGVSWQRHHKMEYVLVNLSEPMRSHLWKDVLVVTCCDHCVYFAALKKNRGFVAQCNLTSMTGNSMFYVIVIIIIIINIIGIVVAVVVVVVVVDAVIIRIVFWHLLLVQLLCRISWNWLVYISVY